MRKKKINVINAEFFTMGRPKINFTKEQDMAILELFASHVTTHEIVQRYEERFSRVSYTALRIRYLEIQNSMSNLSKF